MQQHMMNPGSQTASAQSVEQLLSSHDTDPNTGLAYAEVTRRQSLFGQNEFGAVEREPLWAKFLDGLKDPLIMLLLASAAISAVMKQIDDAISITAVRWLALHDMRARPPLPALAHPRRSSLS